MKAKTRKYTFHLHSGDSEQAICIGELDRILDRIRAGEIKKGMLSQEIGKALYRHFIIRGEPETAPTIQSTVPCLRSTPSIELASKHLPPNIQVLDRAAVSEMESADTPDSAENIKNSLIHLTMSLAE